MADLADPKTKEDFQIPREIGRKCLDWDDDRKHRPGSSKATAEEWQSKTFGEKTTCFSRRICAAKSLGHGFPFHILFIFFCISLSC